MVLLKSSLAFWCALRPYLLESQSSTFFHLSMPQTLLIPKGSRGGAGETSCAPYPAALRARGRGRSRMQQKCDKPEGLRIVEWLARVFPNGRRTKCCPFFWRLFLGGGMPIGRRTKCCPFFPFDFSCHAKVWDCNSARETAGMALLLQSPKLYFPHLPWWLKN